MEGQDASLVLSTQWREMLQLTSKFLVDAAGLINSHLERQRILGPTKSERKEKPKTKRSKTGFQLFADVQRRDLKTKPEFRGSDYADLGMTDITKLIAGQWSELTDEEKKKWKTRAQTGEEVVKEEPHSPTPTKKLLLSQAVEAASDSSSHVPEKRRTLHPAHDSSSGEEEQSSERSSSEERRARRKKRKHKHSSDSKKHS